MYNVPPRKLYAKCVFSLKKKTDARARSTFKTRVAYAPSRKL